MSVHVLKDRVIDSIFLKRLLEIESLCESEGPELYGCEVSFFSDCFIFFFIPNE